MKNTFVISCPIDTYSGYGARSRDIVKALINLDKYDVKVMPQRWGNTTWGFINDHEDWHWLKPYIMEVGGKLTQKPDIWSQISVPNEFQAIGEYNIGITAGIETNTCAPPWIEGMNRMNMNLVSSNHSKEVFQNTRFEATNKQNGQKTVVGLTSPIEVLFEGVNLDTYFPTTEPCLIDFDIKESFAYLFVGHWLPGDMGEDRKNVGLLIKAFFETFKNKKSKPALILKTTVSTPSYRDRDEIMKRIIEIRNSVNSKNLPNIYLLHGNFTDEEMNSLYNHKSVKSMISLTRGEGFGRPLLEFSLTGKPIITTNWSGHIDFLNPEFTTLLGGQLSEIHPTAQVKDMLIEGSKWFSPNHMEVGTKFKDVFENYKKYIDGGKRQAYHSKTNFSFNMMQNLLGKTLDSNIPEIAKQVPLQLPKLELPKLQKS
tara:strand:+ start:1815 stop:3095 length:1281 start_codon:yes stop_codon:yes gene_type:complete